MKIETHKVVSLKYRLTNDKSGDLIEETNESNPLVFLFGVGSMLADFERNLENKIKGDGFSFSIKAKQAYGEYNAANVDDLPANIFHDETGNFDHVMFQVGSVVPMSDGQGNHLRGTILEISDDIVKMDFNHPLAGTDLCFQGEILDIRDASKDEIDHGHVHGEHGHHH